MMFFLLFQYSKASFFIRCQIVLFCKLGDELEQCTFELTCFVPKDRKRAHLELLMLHTPYASVYKRYSHFLR